MSFSSEPPLTRRAAREAARATGEQPRQASGQAPTLTQQYGWPPQEPVAPVEPAVPGAAEPSAPGQPPSLAETGPLDGQPLTRRRLRELREQAATAAGIVVPLEEPPATSSIAVAPGTPPQSETPPQTEAPAAPVEPDVEAPAGTAAAMPPEPRAGWAAPQGHWTRQLEAVDEEDALEGTFSREVGVASPTTSALIIPEAPIAMDLGGPLDSTGEILLTGSVPLSPTLSTTGATDRISDAADRDDRFDDQRLHDTATQDAQPVRAAAVASQHALGTPIVSEGKPRGSRTLTVLFVTASALAIIVTGLVVAAIALRWI